MQKLHLDPDLSDDQERRTEARLKQAKEVVIFYTIRLAIAPVIETLILLDRVAFIREKGKPCPILKVLTEKKSNMKYSTSSIQSTRMPLKQQIELWSCTLKN